MKANNLQVNFFYVLECTALNSMIKGLQQTIEYQHNLKGKLEKKFKKIGIWVSLKIESLHLLQVSFDLVLLNSLLWNKKCHAEQDDSVIFWQGYQGIFYNQLF